VASRAAQLAVELQEKGASQVAGGLDDVTASAKRMGDTVDAASKQAKTAGDRMDSAAGGADELASKGSQAAGAMGGLGDLIGGPFGAAMQTGGIAMQAAADSGDLLNAALENSVVASARAKAATISKTVADKASAAATKVMTVAQKALNLAQRASPLGAIIFGLGLLVGAIILAYKKSDTFRAIVQKAMSVAKGAVDKVVGGFKALGPVVKAVMAVVAKVVGTYVKIYVAAFQLGFKLARAAWEGIRAAVSAVVSAVVDKVSGMRSKLSAAWDIIKRAGVKAFDAITAPVQRIIDLVQKLLDKISSIHLPNVPGLGKLGGLFGGGGSVAAGLLDRGSGSAGVTNVYDYKFQISLTGSASPSDADALMASLDRRLRAVGKAPVFT